jgi:hypothetical protein
MIHFPLEYAAWKVQENEGLKLRGKLDSMVCADVNFLDENISSIKNRKVLIVASDEFGRGVNAEKSKYHFYQKIK